MSKCYSSAVTDYAVIIPASQNGTMIEILILVLEMDLFFDLQLSVLPLAAAFFSSRLLTLILATTASTLGQVLGFSLIFLASSGLGS